MAVLEFLQSIRNPFLDKLMLAVTALGDETAFLVAALIMFWCVDKRKGYFILNKFKKKIVNFLLFSEQLYVFSYIYMQMQNYNK